MKKSLLATLLIASLSVAAFFIAPTAMAAKYSCGKDSSGNTIYTSIDFGDKCTGEGTSSLTAVLLTIIDFMAVGVGIAVVGGIAWGGLVYAMADGDSGKTKEAVQIIINAVIGLVLFFVLYAGANFFVPGGVLN